MVKTEATKATEMTCFECGDPKDHDHHVVPLSRGGTKTIPLCSRCHGLAHHKRMTTSQLTRDVMARKRARGEYLGGSVPFGFTRKGNQIIVASKESEEVTHIARLRAEGMSYRSIAADLTARGVRTRKGGPWQAMTVHRILRLRAEAVV